MEGNGPFMNSEDSAGFIFAIFPCVGRGCGSSSEGLADACKTIGPPCGYTVLCNSGDQSLREMYLGNLSLHSLPYNVMHYRRLEFKLAYPFLFMYVKLYYFLASSGE